MSVNILTYKNKFLLLYMSPLCESVLHCIGIRFVIQVHCEDLIETRSGHNNNNIY